MKIRTINSLSVLILIACLLSIPQHSTAALWAKTYGNIGEDCAYSIQQTSDGGYVVAGKHFGGGFWILKLDAAGSISWQKLYGGSGYESAYSIQQTTDGGYVVAGETGGYISRIWVLKLDLFGNISWQKTCHDYSGIESFIVANSIQQTTDGGYVVAGKCDSGSGDADFCILKLDATGNITWQKSYDRPSSYDSGEVANSIQQITDGGYVVAGFTSTFYYTKILILKLDTTGSISWQKMYGPIIMVNSSSSIQHTADGGYVVAWTDGGAVHVLKLDATGNITWQKVYDSGYADSFISSIRQTADGGYVLAGNTDDQYLNKHLWVLRIDEAGNVCWRKAYGGGQNQSGPSIQQTTDGGYVVAANTSISVEGMYEDFRILKLDQEGNIPGADFITTTSASVTDTYNITSEDAAVYVQTINPTVIDTYATPQNSVARVGVQAYTTDWVALASPTSEDLNGVWGITETRFYAVGNSGTVLDYDGTDWEEQYLGTDIDFNGIWGTSTSDVFIVGDSGTIYHYGIIWSTQTSGTTNNLNGIWGTSSSNVFAVGDGGTVLKYNGSTWSMSTPTTENLHGIWGIDSTNIYAVGDNGKIIKYNGSTWNTVINPATDNLNAIWGTDNGTVTHIYAVGDSGTILHTTNGTTWELVDVPTVSNLNGIWGSKPSNIFVVGDEGTILYYGGQHWIEMDSGIMDDLRSPFGIANPHVFVVGFAGYIGLLQGPYLYGTICDSCTGDPLTGIQVTWDGGPPTGGTFTTTKEVYEKFGIGGGYHTLEFEKTNYTSVDDTIALPPNKIDVDHRTYLVPTTYSQYNGCVSGVVAKDILIDGSYPDGVVTKGVKEPRINVKLYKPGGCGGVEVENVYTNQNGHYHFPTITKPGLYTLRMLNPDPQHCTVKTYDLINHQLQDQDSFPVLIPQFSPTRYDFKLECAEGLVE